MFRFYYLKPSVIGYYQKPISLPLMIPYSESEESIGYIGGKFISVGSHDFSL